MIYRHGKRIFTLLAFLLVAFSHSAAARDRFHIVVKGDTIFSISRAYEVSQDELMRNNGISDASKLLIGTRLTIPSPAAHPEYTVKKNETLYSIARDHGVTLQGLRDINGFSRNHVLKAGEKIKIPNSAPPPLVVPPPEVVGPPPTPTAPRPPVRATARPVDPSIR